MEWSWKIRNLSLCSIIIEHCHLVHNFPPVPEMISQIQSDPSPLGYSVFSKDLGKYAIWVYVVKYFNIAIWFRISPSCQISYRKFNPTLFQRATAFFVQKGFVRFSKKCSQILRAHFLFTPILYSHPYLTHSSTYLIPTVPLCTVYDWMVLENTQVEFIYQNNWTLPFGSEIPPGSRDVIKSSIWPFTIGLLLIVIIPRYTKYLTLIS